MTGAAPQQLSAAPRRMVHEQSVQPQRFDCGEHSLKRAVSESPFRLIANSSLVLAHAGLLVCDMGGGKSEYGIWQSTNNVFLPYIYRVQIFSKLFVFSKKKKNMSKSWCAHGFLCLLVLT